LNRKLLIDEDSQGKPLVNLLRKAGYDVITANEAGLAGVADSIVLDYAKEQYRVLLTQNCDDFKALHQENPYHPGILVIYHNNDPSKDMSRQAIVRAISNLEAANISLANQFISLNQWNY
jgi:predicted nuclease of predicted toxin-antitoxin system